MSGDLAEITGVIGEYHGLSEIQTDASQITILSRGEDLPTAVDLNPPLDNTLALDYLEALEGMLVHIQSAKVVGPTDQDRLTWVVRTDLEVDRIFNDDPRGTGELVSIGDDGLFALNASAKVSDRIEAIYGVLEDVDGVYTALLLQPPSLIIGELPPNDQATPGEFRLTLATFNLRNLFDTFDDPNTDDDVVSSAMYQRKLKKLAMAIHGPLGEPDLLAVQEAENDGVLRDLSLRPEIITDYDILWVDTPDPRGQDTALLYRPDRFAVLDYQVRSRLYDLSRRIGTGW